MGLSHPSVIDCVLKISRNFTAALQCFVSLLVFVWFCLVLCFLVVVFFFFFNQNQELSILANCWEQIKMWSLLPYSDSQMVKSKPPSLRFLCNIWKMLRHCAFLLSFHSVIPVNIMSLPPEKRKPS